MKSPFSIIVLLFSFLLSIQSKAQSCDPWIVNGYQLLLGRGPSGQECNIRNYHNGSWNSYAELLGYIASYNKLGDPWITQAYYESYSRIPTAWERLIQNYNGGSWNSYAELKQYIQQYQSSLTSLGISVSVPVTSNGKALAVFSQNGTPIAVDLISQDGAGIVAQGAGNIVAQGAGNIVAQGAGNLQNLPGASFGGQRTVMSAGTKVIPTSGKGAIVIRK